MKTLTALTLISTLFFHSLLQAGDASTAQQDVICAELLESFKGLSSDVGKRLERIASKIGEIESLEELHAIHAEILSIRHNWGLRVETLKRLGTSDLSYQNVEGDLTRLQKLITGLVAATEKEKDNAAFMDTYIQSILVHSAEGFSADKNDMSTLLAGLKARPRVDLETLRRLSEITVQLQDSSWIPAETRAKLALEIWRKKGTAAEDSLSYLPFVYKNLPEGVTPIRVLSDYLHSGPLNGWYTESFYGAVNHFITYKTLTHAQVSSFVNLYREMSQHFKSNVALRVASVLSRENIAKEKFFEVYKAINSKVGSYSGPVANLALAILEHGKIEDMDAYIKFNSTFYQAYGSSNVSLKYTAACVRFNCIGSAQKVADAFRSFYELTSDGNAAGTLLGTVIEVGITSESVERAIALYNWVSRQTLNHYRRDVAMLAGIALKSHTTDAQLPQFIETYNAITHFAGLSYTVNRIALFKGIWMLGGSPEALADAKQIFGSLQSRFQHNIKFAVQWTIYELKARDSERKKAESERSIN